jgi:hypothetical protein
VTLPHDHGDKLVETVTILWKLKATGVVPCRAMARQRLVAQK